MLGFSFFSPQNYARTPTTNQQENIRITPITVEYTCKIAPISRKISPIPPIKPIMARLALVDMLAASFYRLFIHFLWALSSSFYLEVCPGRMIRKKSFHWTFPHIKQLPF